MGKINLIIEREYLSRVRKKTFIIMSIIGPILFAALMVLPAWFASLDDSNTQNIAIIDHSGLYTGAIPNTKTLKFDLLIDETENDLKKDYTENGYDAYLIISNDLLINPSAIKLVSESQITMDVKNHITRNLKIKLDQDYLNRKQKPELIELIAELKKIKIDLSTTKIDTEGIEKKSSTEITMVLSILFSMMIYMFVLIYGTQVMRGVMEEKNNRIVEVIISSVKPFQLMMGKIIGIALVALTQFCIWVVLTFVIVNTIGISINSGMQTPVGFQSEMANVLTLIDWRMVNWALAAFLFYFLGGYLLYAGMFAAIGSATDTDTDTQQFVLPVMMPLILSIYVAMSAFKNPNGDLAFWFSMIPLTSPVVMMARIPFQIPLWQILLSMSILTATFITMTWFAGRVYRTGILMYGKKPSYKEMWKWFKISGK